MRMMERMKALNAHDVEKRTVSTGGKRTAMAHAST